MFSQWLVFVCHQMRRRDRKLGCSPSASFFVLCPPPSPSRPNLALSPTCTASFFIQFYFLCSGSSIPSAYHNTYALVDRCWHCTHTHIYTERIPLEFQIHLNSQLFSPPPQLLARKVMVVCIATICVCFRQEFPYTDYKGWQAGEVTKTHKHTLACLHLWNCWLAISMHFTLAGYF